MLVIAIVCSLPSVKGLIGEKSVAFFLKKLNGDEYEVFHDVYLPTSHGITQIDHIVISRYGIFIIETKNYKGWIYGSERNQYWTQVIYKRKEKFYNPIKQNYGHIKALQSFLGVEENDIFYSIISFSTRSTLKKVDVQTENVAVIYTPRIAGEIMRHQTKCLSNFTMNKYLYQIRSLKKPTQQEKREHIQQIKKRVTDGKYDTCPRCGGQLVHRSGKYGPFIGCDKFPSCRYIAKKDAE